MKNIGILGKRLKNNYNFGCVKFYLKLGLHAHSVYPCLLNKRVLAKI